MSTSLHCLLGAITISVVTLPRSADANAPAGHYVVTAGNGTGNGTVYDTKSQLTWQQTAPATTYTSDDAKTYCASVGAILGSTGWRLPTLEELRTIVDPTQANPSIDSTVFPSTPADRFWSSSPVAPAPSNAWAVFFDSGQAYSLDVSLTSYVRCVRGTMLQESRPPNGPEHPVHANSDSDDERPAWYDRPGTNLGFRVGFAFGGDTIVTATMSDGSKQTLDAGRGAILALSLAATPLWIADLIGFGGGVEIGWKYQSITASNGSIELSRFPLIASLHLISVLNPQWYLRLAGGVEKDLSVGLSGNINGTGGSVNLQSSLGGMGELGVYYRLVQHFTVDIAVRYTGISYSANGESSNARSFGSVFGLNYSF